MKNKSKISDAFTCKTFIAGERKTPAKITLLGDKRKPESAQHVIEFPGGAIEVSRTSDGNYWAHIHVNRDWANNDCDGFRNTTATIIGSRIGHANGVDQMPEQENITQLAVLIKPNHD